MDMVHYVVFCFKKYIGIIVLSILRCKTAPLSLFPLFKLTRSYNAYGEKKRHYQPLTKITCQIPILFTDSCFWEKDWPTLRRGASEQPLHRAYFGG